MSPLHYCPGQGTPCLNTDGSLLPDLPSSQLSSSYGFVALPGIWSSDWKAQISPLEQLKLIQAKPGFQLLDVGTLTVLDL